MFKTSTYKPNRLYTDLPNPLRHLNSRLSSHRSSDWQRGARYNSTSVLDAVLAKFDLLPPKPTAEDRYKERLNLRRRGYLEGKRVNDDDCINLSGPILTFIKDRSIRNGQSR